MIFKLSIDKNSEEEITAVVHERTPLIDEIERLVLQNNYSDRIPGYVDDEIGFLKIQEIECLVVESEKTFALYSDRKKYLIRKRLYELEGILPDIFERISKSAIANWNKIIKFNVQLSDAVDAVFKSGYT